MIRRGEIYFADLSPVVGSEQGGVRPVLIISDAGIEIRETVADYLYINRLITLTWLTSG